MSETTGGELKRVAGFVIIQNLEDALEFFAANNTRYRGDWEFPCVARVLEVDNFRATVGIRASTAAAINAALNGASDWVPVGVRLPALNVEWPVLRNGRQKALLVRFDDRTWADGDGKEYTDVTHWFDLPELPAPPAVDGAEGGAL